MIGREPAGGYGSDGPRAGEGRRAERPRFLSMARGLRCALFFLCASPCLAASNNVRITGLSDIAFGTVANLSADAVQSESLCVYANTAANGYNVRAIGSGSGGSFSLSSGTADLPFEVQWSPAAGQSSGVSLAPNVAVGGQVSSATQQTCNAGPAASASLILILRTAALSSAEAGTYNGSLTLVIGPE